MTVPRRTPRARLALPVLVAGAALAGACAEVGTDPDRPTSILFDRLPSPSIEAGDTLRDSSGRAVPLREVVTVYNGRGAVIPDAPVTFAFQAGSTPLATITPDGWLVARADTQSTRPGQLEVRAGNLQPPALPYVVVRSPTRIVGTAEEMPRLVRGQDQPQTSSALAARVVRDYTDADTAAVAGVPSYLVRYELLDAAEGVLDSVGFSTGSGSTQRLRTATWDTTGTSGETAPTLRLWFDRGLAAGAVDTVRVKARIMSRGQAKDSVTLSLEVRTSAPPAAR